MATLYDGKQKTGSFTYDGDNDYFYITFDEDGEANFWSAPVDPAMDIKMYVYNNDENDLLETEHNRNKDNRNVLIPKLPVKAGTEYKIRLRHYGGPEGDYYIKAKNYPTTSIIEFDYEIESISPDKSEPFKVGDGVEFEVEVYNCERSEGPDYKVLLKDRKGKTIAYKNRSSIGGKKTKTTSLATTIKEDDVVDGKVEFKFVVESRDSDYEDSFSSDNKKTVKYQVKNSSSESIYARDLERHIEEYTDFTCDGVRVKIPYYITPTGTKLYGGKKTPAQIKTYLRTNASSPSDYQACANRNKRYTGVDCSGFVAYVLNETTNGKILAHWNTTYGNGILAHNLTNPSQGTVINKAKDMVPGCVMGTARNSKGKIGHIIVVYKVVKANGKVTEVHYAHSNGSKGPHKGYVEIRNENQDLDGSSQVWHDIAYTDAQAKGYYNHTILLDCVKGHIS